MEGLAEIEKKYVKGVLTMQKLESYLERAERKFFKEGREEGREEGRKERGVEIALRMLKEGMSLGNVVKYTGLSRERVEELAGK